jgi:hypothetical protein
VSAKTRVTPANAVQDGSRPPGARFHRRPRLAIGATSVVAIVLVTVGCVPGTPTPGHQSAAHAICNHGTYDHIPGDFPEYGPPQTLYVGTTPDGHGSVFRVQAQAPSVALFFANGAGQINYVFLLQGTSTDPASLLWREQSDFNCRGTMSVQTDPADPGYTIYSAEPSDAAYAYPSHLP